MKVWSPNRGCILQTWVHWVSILLSVALYLIFGLVYNAVCYQCAGLTNPYMVMQVIDQTQQHV